MNAVKPSTSFSGSLGTSRREALGTRLSGLCSPSPTHDYESPLTGGVRWRWFNCVKTTRKHRGVQSEHRVLTQDSCAVSCGGSRSLAWHKVKMLLKTLTSILQFKWSTIISSSVQCKISTLPCRGNENKTRCLHEISKIFETVHKGNDMYSNQNFERRRFLGWSYHSIWNEDLARFLK